MNDLITASRTVELAQSLFARVKPTTLSQFIADGKSRYHNVKVIPLQGVLEGQLETETMVYKPIEDSEVFIPDWVQERINWATTNYKVKQVILGDEKEDPLTKEQEHIQRAAAMSQAVIKAIGIAVAGVLVATVAALALAAIAGLLLMVGAAVLAVAALGSGVMVLDPQVCIILEDDPRENWICVGEWLHSSSQ